MPDFDFKNPDYRGVIKRRCEIIRKIRSSPVTLVAAKKHYKTHPIHFIEHFMWTIDPRKIDMSLLPFILFPKQREYIEWLYNHYLKREDGIVEKSRDVGASWLSCAFATWIFLFYDNHSIGFGSNKEANVDESGNPKSLFEKVRILLRHLPIEFLPQDWDEGKHSRFLRIINPENGSTIVGEGGTNIGRGGRTTMYFKDESAFYEQALKIEQAISMNSDVKIDISTPNGVGNVFYKKRFSKNYDVFVFDWKDDPRKDMEWYLKEKKKLDSISPVVAANELDRDYFASIEDMCIPYEYIKSAVNLKLEASGKITAGLDVADEGRDSNAIVIRQGPVVTYIKDWSHGNTSQTARKAHQICLDEKVEVINYDSIGVGAGIKGEFSNIKEREKEMKMSVVPVNVGLPPTKGNFCKNRKNVDQFLNLKAELWWKMRVRFEKTYEFVREGKDHPADELISIPNNDQLIRELSGPQYTITEAGKIKIESKEHMKKRGLQSPNIADALMLSFCTIGISNIRFRMLD